MKPTCKDCNVELNIDIESTDIGRAAGCPVDLELFDISPNDIAFPMDKLLLLVFSFLLSNVAKSVGIGKCLKYKNLKVPVNITT
jgi:hypothetical protein